MSYSKDFDHDGEKLRVSTKAKGDDVYQVMVGDRSLELRATQLPDGRLRIEHDGKRYDTAVGRAGKQDLQVRLGDRSYLLTAHAGASGAGGAVGGDGVIVAPMTGTVLQINVETGDTVTADQTVAVLTAMKMEHKLRAGIDGTVTEVLAAAGAAVDQGTVVLRIE